MVETDPVARRVDCRVVYWGPPDSGKTANLRYLYQQLDPDTRGKLISPSDTADRAFFFDFLAVHLGVFDGYETRLHLYTIPGDVENPEGVSRILRGVDAVVLVADSDSDRLEENAEAVKRLEADLAKADRKPDDPVWVFQYNKRDHPDSLPVEDLEARLNHREAPSFEAVATSGDGVVETLEEVGVRILRSLDLDEAGGGS